MAKTYPDRKIAEAELKLAGEMNPGKWVDHSINVAKACEIIAKKCPELNSEKAYVLGLLHDIGRRIGFCGQKHIYAGYAYALEKGWTDVARISLTHSYYFKDANIGVSAYDGEAQEFEFVRKYIAKVEFDEYDRLLQLTDALGCAEGFCIIEKRIVDVALRYGEMPKMIEKWRKMFETKHYFDEKCGCNVYDLLPGIKDNL